MARGTAPGPNAWWTADRLDPGDELRKPVVSRPNAVSSIVANSSCGFEEASGTNRCTAFHPEATSGSASDQGSNFSISIPDGAAGNPHQDLLVLRKRSARSVLRERTLLFSCYAPTASDHSTPQQW